MASSYPIMLCLQGRLVVVVGAGPVGLRRAEGLAAAGAVVRVIDPAGGGKHLPAGVELVEKPFEPSQLDGAMLAFACTDDPAINERVVADGRARGVLVNRSDEASAGDFTVPAVHRGKGLTLAVGTTGGAPAVAAAIRDLLAEALPDQAEPFALALAELRERLKAEESDEQRRRRLLRRAGGPEGLAAFQRAGRDGLEELLAGE